MSARASNTPWSADWPRAAWGSGRTTQDVDIVVDIAARPRVIAFAESQGFTTLHVSDAFSNHTRGSDQLDFMYVERPTAEQIFARAEERTFIGGVALNVARPEHLAAMKANAIKSAPRRAFRDISDVIFLLRIPGIDREFVRDYFARKGLLDVFDEIEKRI